MSVNKIEVTVGKEAPEGDDPKGQEVVRGEKPVFAAAGDEVGGRSHWKFVVCYACCATNQVGGYAHAFNCFNCGCYNRC